MNNENEESLINNFDSLPTSESESIYSSVSSIKTVKDQTDNTSSIFKPCLTINECDKECKIINREEEEEEEEEETRLDNVKIILNRRSSSSFSIFDSKELNKKDDKKSIEINRRIKSSLSLTSNNIKKESKPKQNNFKSLIDLKSNSIQMESQIVQESTEPQVANQKPIAAKPNITVDTSKSRSNSEVLRMCIQELGWQDCPTGLSTGCDIIWQSCTSHESREQTCSNSFFTSSSRLNKFPSMNQLLKKGPLTLSLNVMRRVYKYEYDFYPRTWFLPEQLKEFSQECRYIHDQETKMNKLHTTFIVKPNDGSQGDGIYLIKSPQEYLNNYNSKNYIVQEYIHNPFLIDGLKFDLRIYVVILNLKPLEIYICDEGLVRFATIDYQTPNEKNLNEIYMHLTNYSLNKKNQKFYQFTSNQNESELDDAGFGSKRKLSKIYNYLQKKGYNINKLKSCIDDLIIKTIFALLPEMKVETTFEIFNSPNKQRPSSFQIIGFDILIKDDLKPVLLEVNCNPSLRIDYETESLDGKIITLPSPIDVDIKKPLVLETLKLACPKKKQELIEKLKKEEEQIEKAVRVRNFLVKQRIEQRLLSAKGTRKINFDKCPLLSKPGEQYIKSKLKLKSTTNLLLLSTTTTTAYNNQNQAKKPILNLNDSNLEKQKENKSCLRNIYPNTSKSTTTTKVYSHLFIQESIADLFIYFTLHNCTKQMTHSDFRNFIKKCNLISKKLTADNLDIIYFDLSKKWEMYNNYNNYNNNKKKIEKDATTTIKTTIRRVNGICYQGFVECFTKLSLLIFNETTLEKSLKSMIFYCKFSLKRDGFKSSQYYSIEIQDDLYPLSQNLLNELDNLRSNRNHQLTSDNSNDQINFIEQLNTTINYNKSNINNINNNNNNNNSFKTKKSIFPIFFDTIV